MWNMGRNYEKDVNPGKLKINYFSRTKTKLLLKKFTIILISILSQHINLFKNGLFDYNFKLLFYIILIQVIIFFNNLEKHLKYVKPIHDYGLKNLIYYLKFLAISLIIYFLLSMHENFTNIRIIILSY